MKKPSVAALLLIVVLPIYAWRLTLGVDLSDESYYALVPVSWLRSTPAETGNLSVHQLAATLTYPFVKVYAWLRPDLKGLILALRGLYGGCAVVTMLLAYWLLVRLLPPLAAVACASVLLVFIPFGLPAPSYNTLGMLGMMGGVYVVGRLILEREAAEMGSAAAFRPTDWRGATLAGALFAIGSAAYPTLVVLPAASLALFAGLFVRQRRLTLLVFACWSVWGLALLAAIVSSLGGPARLAQMAAFASQLDGSLGLGNKLRQARAMLGSSPVYLSYCSAALLLGLVRRLVPWPTVRVLHLIAVVILAVGVLYRADPPIFYTKGHDLVFILTAAGLPALPFPRRSQTPANRLLASLYLIGLAGGLVTSYTATYSLYNFNLLGILAVVAGMAAWLVPLRPIADATHSVVGRLLAPAWALGLAGLLGWSSVQHIYAEGDIRQVKLSARIRHGPFAGLRTRPELADLLRKVSQQIAPYGADYHTLEVLGQPGLYLLTPFELRSPMPFPLLDSATRRAYPLLARYYDEPGHRPDLILWFHNFPLELNRVQVELVGREYQVDSEEGPVTIYVRRDGPPGERSRIPVSTVRTIVDPENWTTR
jgi:hypothetical protein